MAFFFSNSNKKHFFNQNLKIWLKKNNYILIAYVFFFKTEILQSILQTKKKLTPYQKVETKNKSHFLSTYNHFPSHDIFFFKSI